MFLSYDFFLLQFVIFLVLISLFYFKDTVYIILNGVIFLSFMSMYAWLNNLDVLINFLIIIDLGVFFTLLAFSFNLIFIFESNFCTKTNTKITPVFLISVFFSLLVFKNETIEITPLFLDYVNWYLIFNTEFLSDMQLLSEIYFSYNFFEFILMNLILYLGLLVALFIIQLRLRFSQTIATTNLNSKIQLRWDNLNYLKSQNIQSQIKQSSVVRVWSSNLKYNDSKRNLNKINW